jgi:hypothetical protein
MVPPLVIRVKSQNLKIKNLSTASFLLFGLYESQILMGPWWKQWEY